jgi:hypothetical protein
MSGIIIISKRRQTLTQKVEGGNLQVSTEISRHIQKIVKWIFKNGREKMPV